MARLRDTIIGHELQLERLEEALKLKRLPRSLVLAGPSGVGKKLIALSIAQSLVCENTKVACGECGPCRRIKSQQSESLLLLKPEGEPGKKATIKVEAVRDLRERLSLSSVSHARVVIIDDAQLMNEQASNALLKSLEEPSNDVYFILVVTESQLLLPTIQSRVQVMRFGSLNVNQLKNIRPELPDWSYHSARGQLDRLTLLTSKQGVSERAEALELFQNFYFNDEFLMFDDWRKALKEDRNWALFALQCWLQIVRDAIAYKAGRLESVMNRDQVSLLTEMEKTSFEKLVFLASKITGALKDVRANQDASLVVDAVRVEYARMD